MGKFKHTIKLWFVVLALTTIRDELLKEMNSQLREAASHYVGRLEGVYEFMQSVWQLDRKMQQRREVSSNLYLIFRIINIVEGNICYGDH